MRTPTSTVNAGSMADIAFLLLIFFLITTTIQTDAGVPQKLSEPCDIKDCTVEILERNRLTVAINGEDKLLVNEREAILSEIRGLVVDFISNPNGEAQKSENSKEAFIALTMNRQSSYETYVAVLNEVKAAYDQLKTAYAQENYGKDYKSLEPHQCLVVDKMFPENIAEASL